MLEIIKNKEEVKSVMNIIQAFADGKTIQAIDPYDDEWVDQTGLNFKALFERQYRIKPEPKFRPFKDAEECWQEMKKHQPFGWVKSTLFKDFALVKIVTTLYFEINRDIIDYKDSLEKFTFADGTPFGVKLE